MTRIRALLLLGGLVVVAVLALAVTGAREQAGLLDPAAVDAQGSRALAQVLRGQGVDVRLVRTAAAAAATPRNSTVLVAGVGLLADPARAAAQTKADVVLVAPSTPALAAAAPWARSEGTSQSDRTDPGCALAEAIRAGSARIPGSAYTASAPTDGSTQQLCYPASAKTPGSHLGLVVREEPGGRRVSVLGSSEPFTNAHIGDEGNAALVLGLLGRHPSLVWYLPSPADVPPGDRRSLLALLPAGVRFAVVQVGVAVLVAALWRARRLGPVVSEPLPVVVPAGETVVGHGRLYLRARARDRAAAALREASRHRLGSGLGLPRAAPTAALVEGVAARGGRAPGDVGVLLYGAAPTDDAGLVQLAEALDDLERAVATGTTRGREARR